MRGRKTSQTALPINLPRELEQDVERAVDTALAGAHDSADVESVAHSWANSRGRHLTIEEAQLPLGIFGQWLSSANSDIIQIRSGVVARERTIAHELGHMILGHRGTPVNDYLAQNVQVIEPSLVNYLLHRSCEASTPQPLIEACAELFAARLTWRLHSQKRPNEGRLSLDETFG